MTTRTEYQRTWRAKNKDRIAGYNKTWRAKNPERATEVRARAAAKHYRATGKANRKRWRDANPELVSAQNRRTALKRAYALTPEQWDQMFEAQGRTCACCGEQEPGSKRGWVVDHCHRTSAVRGIVCHHCNIGLGTAKDSVQTLRKWIAYLELRSKHQQAVHDGADEDLEPSAG